jgi:hypothetical protein
LGSATKLLRISLKATNIQEDSLDSIPVPPLRWPSKPITTIVLGPTHSKMGFFKGG